MYNFSVHYTCFYGRHDGESNDILRVQVKSYENPQEFFLAIKELMGNQCDEACTSQYCMIHLSHSYLIKEYDGEVIHFSHHKFSNKFMKEVSKLRAPRAEDILSFDDEIELFDDYCLDSFNKDLLDKINSLSHYPQYKEYLLRFFGFQ